MTNKTCIICHHIKPISRFGFLGDNTCLICRKLLKEKIIVSPRADITKATFFRGVTPVTCVTCNKTYNWDMFPNNSYECRNCTEARHNMEKARLNGIDYQVLCTVCDTIKPVTAFPYGEFICKSCINKTNRYKGGKRYAK